MAATPKGATKKAAAGPSADEPWGADGYLAVTAPNIRALLERHPLLGVLNWPENPRPERSILAKLLRRIQNPKNHWRVSCAELVERLESLVFDSGIRQARLQQQCDRRDAEPVNDLRHGGWRV